MKNNSTIVMEIKENGGKNLKREPEGFSKGTPPSFLLKKFFPINVVGESCPTFFAYVHLHLEYMYNMVLHMLLTSHILTKFWKLNLIKADGNITLIINFELVALERRENYCR